MIIADDFVFLHNPKTGGSFVTEVLRDLYAGHLGHPIKDVDKHGWTDQIPAEHRSKQIVTTIRNPFDYYASHYVFGYWIDRELTHWPRFKDNEEARKRFPDYPYISFPDFLEICFEIAYNHLDPALQPIADFLRLGPMTVIMLQYLTPDYHALLKNLAASGDMGALKQSVARTRVLHTESLAVETYHWLLQLGVSPEVAEPVLSRPKIQPTNTPDGVALERGHGQPRRIHWSKLFDERSRASVLQRDWLIFELFPEYRRHSIEGSCGSPETLLEQHVDQVL